MSVVAGMVVYATLGRYAYVWVAITLVLISAGLRVVGLVAGVNVMKGAPENRTSIAAAMVDTTDEITSSISVAIVGTIIAAMFVGDFTSGGTWTAEQGSRVRYRLDAQHLYPHHRRRTPDHLGIPTHAGLEEREGMIARVFDRRPAFRK